MRMCCKFSRTSTSPPHPTQPKKLRSMRMCCKFSRTSVNIPTPPHQTQECTFYKNPKNAGAVFTPLAMICIESRPMSKSMFTRKEGNPKYMTFVSCVLRMISRPWAFCDCIGEFEKRSNLSYRFIFRESLAKVLLKPWRKTAFIWRLL